MTQRLLAHLFTVDSTMRSAAKELAKKRSRLVYTVTLVTMDAEYEREASDPAAVAESFVFDMYTAGTAQRTFADDYLLRRNFTMKPDTALRCELRVQLINDDMQEVRVHDFCSGRIEWDAREIIVHNSYYSDANFNEGNRDWVIELEYTALNKGHVLNGITVSHDPARCVGLMQDFEHNSITVQENRLKELLRAVPFTESGALAVSSSGQTSIEDFDPFKKRRNTSTTPEGGE